jgi:tryptophan-rich sensory protein
MALKQPPYRPPPHLFGPTWTILYGLMGYSAYRAYSTGMHPLASTEKHLLTKHGATLYTIQLGYTFPPDNPFALMELFAEIHACIAPMMSYQTTSEC